MPGPPRRRRRASTVAAAFAAAMVLFIAVDGMLLVRVHAGGHAQAVLAYLDGLAALAQSPGVLVADGGAQLGTHHFTARDWAIVLAVDFLFYASLAWGWCRLRRRRNVPPVPAPMRVPGDGADADATADADAAPALRSRRQFLSAGAKFAGLGVAATTGYALVVEPRRYEVTRRSIRIRGLPPALDGLTIAHLTDVHLGPWLSLEYVREVVAATNALGADVIALTGDYVHKSWRYIDPVMRALSQLRPKIGAVATLGNHDHYEGAARCAAGLARAGIPLIDNARLMLTPARTIVPAAEEGLCLAGVGDLWRGVQDYRAALGGLPDRMPRLLLSHNPDVAEEPALRFGGLRVDLMLSGHTHGGQVYVPGLGTPILPSNYGQKYASGLVQGPVCPVFVCRGIGVSSLPIRLGVRPELAVLELRPA